MENGSDELRIQVRDTPQESLTSPNAQDSWSVLRHRSQSPPISSKETPKATKPKTQKKISTKFRSLFLKTQNGASKIDIWKIIICIEIISLGGIIGLLISSLTVHKLQHSTIWSLRLWRWCVLIISIFCGRLIAEYVVKLIVSLIWKFWLDARVLYFVYGVKKSVQFFIWLGFVCLAWGFLFDFEVNRSENTKKEVHHTTRGIGGCLIGVAIWVVKTFLVKVVGSFHAAKLFDKIEEAIRHRKVLMALSDSNLRNIKSAQDQNEQKCENESKKSTKMSSYDENLATMRELIDGILVKKLVALSCRNYSIEGKQGSENMVTNKMGAKIGEIKDAEGAKNAAVEIFDKLAMPKPHEKYVDMDELFKIVQDENVRQAFEDVAENHGEPERKCIKRSLFKKWLVKVYIDHESLNGTLKYSKSAIDELNRLASVIVLVIIVIVWLLFMGILSTKVLVFLSSQLLLAAFMFGNTCKTVFECIIFVFLMHPFDIGDRCVVDGVQMNVEEMTILNTIFLRYDGEKIYYPNSVLAGKPISNLYRSPPMGDSLEFAIDLFTSKDTIKNLQDEIKKYLEDNGRKWSPDHSVQFKEIENVNKMKMALYVNHTVSYHHADKRGNRRSNLVLEMRYIFERLGIKYNLLPQEVRLIK